MPISDEDDHFKTNNIKFPRRQANITARAAKVAASSLILIEAQLERTY